MRQALLLAALAATAALLGAPAAQAQGSAPAAPAAVAPAAFFELRQVGQGVYAAIDLNGRAVGNAGVIIGRDAVAVVDSFINEDAARALLAEVRRLTPLPLRYLINTHHHIDHIGGNRVFAEAGAAVVAQRQVAGWLRSENERLLGGAAISPEWRARLSGLQAPQLLFDDRLVLDLGGGRRLQLQHLQGHTGGDTAIWVEDAGVLFMGDLMWRASVPNLIDAQLWRWIATLDALQSLPAATVVVPGHGSVAGLADLREFRAYLVELRRLAEAALQDKSLADAAQRERQVLEALTPRYGAWAFFKSLAAANVRDALAEVEHRKRVPEALPAPRPLPQP